MILAALLLAAIVTERNDLYNDVGCLTPSHYSFVGNSTHPGIESCWIPYGTYTSGTGSVEYLRVTGKLMGVVASALGGLAERSVQVGWGPDKYMLRPAGIPDDTSWSDDGAFLDSPTNLSLRIADQLNLSLMSVRIDGTNYTYDVSYGHEDNCLEHRLLSSALSFGSRRLDALTGNEEPPIPSAWSPNLPYHVADSNLWRNVYPLFGFCTNDIHFLPNGYYRERRLPNPNPNGWGSLEGLWGDDFGQSLADLNSALAGMPLDVTIEDVLSYDTGWDYAYPPRLTNDYWTIQGMRLTRSYIIGEWDDLANADDAYWTFQTNGVTYFIEAYHGAGVWYYFAWDSSASEYLFERSMGGSPDDTSVDFGDDIIATKTEFYIADDYTHFTNGTTRLDWRRLGIICQLERQMDTTYESNGYGDTLPLWHLNTGHEEDFASSDIEITFPIPEYHGQEMPLVSGLFQDASWNMYYDNYWASTNDYKNTWSTPTCRTPAPGYSNFVELNWSDDSTDIYLGEEQASNIVSTLCHELANSVTGELSHVYFEGEWRPGTGLALDYNADSVFCTVVYKHPSNTVEVSSSDGFHAGGWTYDDVDRHDWDFSDGTNVCQVRFDYGGHVAGGTFINLYDGQTYNSGVYYEDNLHFDQKSGTIATPQVVLTAVGTGDISNLTWQVAGLPGVTNCSAAVLAPDGFYYWNLGDYDQGEGNGGTVACGSDGSWMSVDIQWADGPTVTQYFSCYERGAAFSRVWTSPSITLTWNGYQHTTEEDLYLWGEELQGGSIPAFWDPEGTNATRYAYAAIVKHTSPTFTFATQETRDLTISRFSWPDNALDWSRIYSLRRSELELMLSARDVPWFASDMHAYSIWDQTFTWSAIDDIPHSDRTFRMIQGTTARSRTDANNAQYNLLASLSGECKEKCAAIGGMPVGAIEHVGKVTQSERTAFLDDLKHAKVGATFEIYGRYFAFEADVHYDGGVYEVDAIYLQEPFPALVGSCGWHCYVDYEQSYSVTNRYRDARVDAHQAPVRKTVWKFKNMRDPNL